MKPKIALLDSGIGGLTVFKEIIDKTTNTTYVADNKFFPYGTKSEVDLINIIDRLLYYLFNNDYQKVFLTCNTASNIYSKYLAYKYQDNVIPIIDITISELSKYRNIEHVGIIATNQVIQSGIYEKKIKNQYQVKTTSLAGSDLVELCENYQIDKIRIYLKTYFNKFKQDKIDTLFLGCTHFNLIKNEINEYFDGEVRIICSGYAFPDLISKNYLCYSCGENIIYLTDYNEAYVNKIKTLFGELKKVKIMSLNI